MAGQERRRLQEEQDRAKREMEDERLRMQQLKRKSLRDQWLMEGAPLSPTSLDAQSRRSPLWDSEAQETDQHMDKLQAESHQLAEEKEKLKDQMEAAQTKVVKLAEAGEAGEETAQDDVVQNGENSAAGSETSEDQVKTIQNPPLNETADVITNGSGDLGVNTNDNASKPSTQSTTNGPICTPPGVISMMLEPGLSLSASEAEPGQVLNVNINQEEEEGTLVMRAERVIITDEGDDVSENLTPQEGQPETTQSEENPLLKAENEQEEVAVEGELKAEETLEMFTQPEKSEATEPTTEAQPLTGDGDMKGDLNVIENGDTKAAGQDEQSEDSASLQLQTTASSSQDATVASVPVYSEPQPSSLSPEAEGEVEAAVSPEGAEAAIKVQDPATMPDQFQEVPLTDAQENQRTEAGVGEQEPLLSQSKAHNTQAAPAASNSPASTETHNPPGTTQEEETKTPSRKTCQCCSIM
uniref:Paralemmin 3 n=1 Tax=Anabas testudineus TaxID=64144 RepID=A0A7N6B4X7_ANATE